jgi:hypothetical protein
MREGGNLAVCETYPIRQIDFLILVASREGILESFS